MSGALQAVFQNQRSFDLTSPVTFTEPGNFTVPYGIDSVTVKLFGAGGDGNGGGGSGAQVIGDFAVQQGDVLHAYYTGYGISKASMVTWKRNGVVQGYAIAGAGAAGGEDGQDGGDDWNDRDGGEGGNAGVLSGAAEVGSNAYDAMGGGGGSQSAVGYYGDGAWAFGNGYNGGSSTDTSLAGNAPGGQGQSGTNASGGVGGIGGQGYYGGGSGGGGAGRDDYPESADGGGGGGGGSSFQSNMSNVSSALCVDSSDPNRGTAGNPENYGKVVLIF